jgi:hypothetical protein
MQYSDQVISCGGDPEIATCGRWPRGRSRRTMAAGESRHRAGFGAPGLGAAVTVEHVMQRVRGSAAGGRGGRRNGGDTAFGRVPVLGGGVDREWGTRGRCGGAVDRAAWAGV